MKRKFILILILLTIVVNFGMIQPARAASTDVESLRQSVVAWAEGWSSGDDLFEMSRVDRLYDHSDRFLEFDTISPVSTITKGYDNFQAL